MEKEKFLVFDDNVSLEAMLIEGDVCKIIMYYNPYKDEYICLKLDKENLYLFIEQLVLISKNM